jgi:hypothetical protein
MIQQYVKKHYDKGVKPCWIAHVKEIVGLRPSKSPNRISPEHRKYPCPDEHIEKIKEALIHFKMM